MRFATPRQAQEAIANLRPTDHAKLMLIARGFVRSRLQGMSVDPEDLLQEAVVKTLDGRRRWNLTVTIIKHLDRVMESDSGHIAQKRLAHGITALPDNHAEPAAQRPSPEDQLRVLDELDSVFALFADDPSALALLRLRGNGLPASDIQRDLGMGKTEYETVNKRIRRRLVKYQTGRDQ